MKGTVRISNDIKHQIKDLEYHVKCEIGKSLRIQPPGKHNISYYAYKVEKDHTLYLWDTDIRYKIENVDRVKKFEEWKKSLEDDGWIVNISS